VALGHVLATSALVVLYPRVGSVAGLFCLAAVLFSAFCFGLRGALTSAVAQVVLNVIAMQVAIQPAVPMDGPSMAGIVFFFLAGAAVGNQRDLSRRLREELLTNERLRTRERETLLAIPDAIIRVSSDGGCHFRAEPEPRPFAEVLELALGRILPSDTQAALEEAIARVRATQAAETMIVELPDAAYYDVRAFPCVDRSVQVVIRDITEQRRLLRRATSAENLASLGTLAAGLAHEINNPLTYVVSSVSAVGESLHDRDLKSELSHALDGCWRIRDLVSGILETTTAEREVSEPVLVPDALEAALALANPQTRHRATIRWHADEGLCALAHRTKLMQVVVNLVTNASQSFADTRTSANEISVRAYRKEDSVVIEVEDNGPGMDESTRLRALEPFFTTKEPGQGSGLGLFLCSSIVDSLQGTLQLESEAGRGTKVVLNFPATEEPPPRSRVVNRSVRPVPDTAPQLRVLVVDDEPEIRRALRRILEQKYEVSLCSNGAEALERFDSGERFDVILCDVLMPEMTGVELFGELERRFRDQAERVVFLTGGSTTEATRRFIEGKRTRVVGKPFRSADIESAVGRFARVS
jgi:signal transduction histidine kinase